MTCGVRNPIRSCDDERLHWLEKDFVVVVLPGCFRGMAASYVHRGHKRITLSTEVLLAQDNPGGWWPFWSLHKAGHSHHSTATTVGGSWKVQPDAQKGLKQHEKNFPLLLIAIVRVDSHQVSLANWESLLAQKIPEERNPNRHGSQKALLAGGQFCKTQKSSRSAPIVDHAEYPTTASYGSLGGRLHYSAPVKHGVEKKKKDFVEYFVKWRVSLRNTVLKS